MARARNIKPGFFTNDELAECGPLGQLLFAGLWTIADREGRLRDRPKKIKAETLPYYECDPDWYLGLLEGFGFIHRYQVDGERFIQIVNWNKHQTPHIKEAPSEIPAPDEHSASTRRAPDEHEERIPDSGYLIPDTGFADPGLPEGGVGGRSDSSESAKTKKATRIPNDFIVTDELWNWAAAEGFSPSEIDAEASAFKDYWVAKPGKDGTKLDWVATWRSWMRNSRKFGPRPPNGRSRNIAQDQMDLLVRQGRGGQS